MAAKKDARPPAGARSSVEVAFFVDMADFSDMSALIVIEGFLDQDPVPPGAWSASILSVGPFRSSLLAFCQDRQPATQINIYRRRSLMANRDRNINLNGIKKMNLFV
jgi:hypothetical protein